MTKQNKRPRFWKVKERADYDAMHLPWDEYKARILSPEEAQKFDVTVPVGWGQKSTNWVFKTLGLRDNINIPAGSGAGFVQSPYADIYTRIYGVDPIADLSKYRKMIRTQPDVQQAIELQVSLAIGKGFVIEHKDTKVKEYLNKFSDRINLPQEMTVMGSDMLGYGNSYTEIQWTDIDTTEEIIYKKENILLTKDEISTFEVRGAVVAKQPDSDIIFKAQVIKRKKDKKASIIGLKGLDPLYMRVRRDAWGNVYGYAQWMSAPPVMLDVGNIIHIKYRPKSTGFESAYGCSILMALIKNQDLLTQFENDAATWIHSRAVPPLVLKGGTMEKPYTTPQMKDLLSKFANRSAASIIGVKGDVAVDELQGVSRNLNIQWWLDYLLTRRYQALGVPKILMGASGGSDQAASEVEFQDFITRLQVIQKLISDAIESQVLWPLSKVKFGDTTEKPKIVWKPISEESRDMRTQRLVQVRQLGDISSNELREAIGYERIHGKPELDEVTGKPSGGMNSLGGGKPGGLGVMPSGDPRKTKPMTPETVVKPPPEGVKKKEGGTDLESELRVKKIKLMVSQDCMKGELLSIVDSIKFELKQDDRTVKSIKNQYVERAEDVINRYINDVFLFGKLDSLYSNSSGNVTIDDLSIKKEDVPEIARLKKEYTKNFENIVSDMIIAKGEGLL